jgi:hypothetical protein
MVVALALKDDASDGHPILAAGLVSTFPYFAGAGGATTSMGRMKRAKAVA